jgi:hypothetical protein
VVVAHSRRTGERYPARTSRLEGYRIAFENEDAVCPNREDYPSVYAYDYCKPRTYEYARSEVPIQPVDHYKTKIYRPSDTSRYSVRPDVEHAAEDMRFGKLHYLDGEKDVVCRCNKPKHDGKRPVRSLEIQFLCAEFFRWNASDTKCTRRQWRAGAPDTSHSRSGHCRASKGYPATIDELGDHRVEFSPSPERFHNEAERPRSRHRHSKHSSSSRRRHSKKSSHHKHTRLASRRSIEDGDIPEKVWQASRPSVHAKQFDLGSNASTPLGSVVALAPQDVKPLRRVAQDDHVDDWAGERSGYTHRRKHSSRGKRYSDTRGDTSHNDYSHDWKAVHPEVDLDEMTQLPEVRSQKNYRTTTRKPAATHLPISAVELDATPRYVPHFSPSLYELEGDTRLYVHELDDTRTPSYPTRQNRYEFHADSRSCPVSRY